MSIIPRNIPALAGTLRLSFIAACPDPGLLYFLLSGQKTRDFKYFRPNFENIWEFLSALRELLITSFLLSPYNSTKYSLNYTLLVA